MSSRTPATQLGLADALRARATGLGSWGMVLRIAVATTASYLISSRVSGSELPIFAPITTLMVVQASPFSTLGMTAQRVLGTGLGVAVATVYVSFVPVAAWSVFLAILVSLVVARLVPVGLAGQLQIPLATVFVLALGAGDLAVDLWRVADVALGGLIGVIAVFLAPPRPRIAEARAALDSFAADVVALLRLMAEEIGGHEGALSPDVRHGFVGTSRALRHRTGSSLDAMATAVESVRFNPRARRVGADLDLLDMRVTWLTRLSIQSRSLSGAVDRLYDRGGLPPALPPDALAPLLRALAALVESVDRDGVDDDVHVLDEKLAGDLRLAVATATRTLSVTEALDSLSVIGRLDHLREIAWVGPLPADDIDDSLEDGLDEPDPAATPTTTDRVRRLLTRH